MEYYSVLENGAHSLVKSREKLTQYYENREDKDKRNIFLLKEATIFLSDGIEILLKELLYRVDPIKVLEERYFDIYTRVMEELPNPSKLDRISVISNLKTISLSEANVSVKKHVIFKMSSVFNKQVSDLVIYRNQLFHFSSNPLKYYEELWDTLESAEKFFEKNIADYKKLIESITCEYTTSSVLNERASKTIERASNLNVLEQYEADIRCNIKYAETLERNHH